MSIQLADIATKLRDQNKASNLSPREIELLELVARGWVTKQIAHKFGTSHKTVENQRRGIMDKLVAKTPAHMVWIACQRGLV